MRNVQQKKPTLHLKFLLISPSNSSNKTFLSTQMFLLRLSFSYVSWCFSLRNLSLSKKGTEEEEAFLLALVFLDIVLRKRQDTHKRTKKKTRKTKGRLQVSTKNIEITILYDA